ncbi:MAG: undecaprenyl-diphosphate phosphatase [Alphaproteobacteria bacterium]
MALFHIFVLAVVQGITEFLPISSSGHLVLTGKVLCWPDQGLAMDVAVHVGSLVAVTVYFWRDVWAMFVGLGRLITRRGGPQAQLLVNVVIGTIPVMIVGFFAQDFISGNLRSVEVIAWATIGFGILLWLADHVGMTVWRIDHLRYPSALMIGIAQVLALIPGTSRSGITMTAARFIGLERSDAARFSLLLSIPTIMAAGGLTGFQVYESGNLFLSMDMLVAAGLAFFTALISIAVMMAWLRRSGFGPFVIYRIFLGAGLLYWVYVYGPEAASPLCT